MANTVKIKRGSSAPTTSDLSDFELGFCTSNNLLYIRSGNAIKKISQTLELTLDADSTDETIPTSEAVYDFVDGFFLRKTGGITGELYYDSITETNKLVTESAATTISEKYIRAAGDNVEVGVENWSARPLVKEDGFYLNDNNRWLHTGVFRSSEQITSPIGKFSNRIEIGTSRIAANESDIIELQTSDEVVTMSVDQVAKSITLNTIEKIYI